jgi:hypothetical protein
MKSESHRFFCTSCGNEGIPIMRSTGALREKGHLKKLYCIYCQKEVNHYECGTDAEVRKFNNKYQRGDFNDSES